MKYIYIRKKGTLELARHEVQESEEGACIKVKEQRSYGLTWRYIFLE